MRAAMLGQPGPGGPQWPVVQALHRLDRGPPHQVAALLGDPAPVDLGVGLPVSRGHPRPRAQTAAAEQSRSRRRSRRRTPRPGPGRPRRWLGSPGSRKSTRLNSSHPSISYAVFCLKKKKKKNKTDHRKKQIKEKKKKVIRIKHK